VKKKETAMNDPVIPFITVPDDPPPEYEPDEDPAEDFPQEEEMQQEGDYKAFLEKIHGSLDELHRIIHDRMMVIPGTVQDDRWQEMYVLTRHIHALMDTIRLYQRHDYPPF
jgi:hypothetical protein